MTGKAKSGKAKFEGKGKLGNTTRKSKSRKSKSGKAKFVGKGKPGK
jgi:hypothetical protein